ncbi:MAG: hypothetical protein IJB69_00225 [Clostridia bacterium]|nr:hypothetical protein [Clostridia bacterium]
MKKRIWIVALLALLMTLVSSSALAACGYAWTDGGKKFTCTETSHRIESDWSASTVEDKCIRYLYHYDANQNEELEQRLVAADHNMQFQGNDVEPTCQTTGSARYTCTTCGYPSITNVPRVEHVYTPNGQVTLEEATCQQPALVRQSCVYGCGTSQDVRYGSALSSHKTATRVGKEATCGEEGYYVDYCQWCRKELGKGDTIPATGKHSFSTVYDASKSKFPTCIADGVMVYVCKDCPELKAEVWPCDPDGPYHGWAEKTVQPTCTEDGMTGDACKYCGMWHASAKVLPHPGHNFGPETVVTEATCTACGLNTRNCTVCGYVEETIIEPKGCQFEAVEVRCITSIRGYSAERCVNCQTERNKVMHTGTYGDATTDAPGCEGEGYVHTRCSICDAKLYSITVSGPGHDWNPTYQILRDCVYQGIIEGYICKVCGKTEERLNLYGAHDYVVVSEVPATCTAFGSETKKCTVCGKEATFSKMKLKHEAVATEEVPSTCTQPGHAPGTQCKMCGKILSVGEELPLAPHKSDLTEEKLLEIQEKLGLCMEDGEYATECITCGETFMEKIPARDSHSYYLGLPYQNYIMHIQVWYGLCFESAEVKLKCAACGEEYVEFVPARGKHIAVDGWLRYPLYYDEETDSILADWNLDPNNSDLYLTNRTYYNTCFKQQNVSVGCACGKKWNVTIPAAGRHLDMFNSARQEGYCSVCGECYHQDNPSTTHKVLLNPTCTEDGVQLHDCNQIISINASSTSSSSPQKNVYQCTHTFEEPIYSTGHTWGEWQDGVAVCSVCGITGESGQRSICKDGHTPIDCKGGATICRVCGEKLDDSDAETKCQHVPGYSGAAVLINNAVYLEYHDCHKCGENYLVPKKVWFQPDSEDLHNPRPWCGCEHDELILVTDKQATSTKNGTNHVECMSCGACFATGETPVLDQ